MPRSPRVAAPARPVTKQGTAELPAVMPVMDCAALEGLALDGVTDAPAEIRSARVSVADAAAPYCEVRAVVAPANRVVLRLPVDGWTQRYVQTGCGGRCGRTVINYGRAANCPQVRAGTVASATTDMGHQGRDDGSWAAFDPQAQIDFAYRGVHVTAEVAKAVITGFYGRPPSYSYFVGCSDGGREGLMEAQRYPGDFDGIVAGAPANNLLAQNFFHHGWSVLANRDAGGDPILLAGRLPLLHRAVLAACDTLDGVADGVLTDPRRCDFDPGTLRCAPGQNRARCLSAAEVGAVRRLHGGAVDGQGNRLEPEVAHEWGSELGWSLFVPARPGRTTYSERAALAYGRYLGRPNLVDPSWRLSDLKFTVASFWDAVRASGHLAALDPDLGGFQRAGGKLLLWHGWNDQYIAPRNTLAYYAAMREAMGGAAVDGFARLFLFPGVAHCAGGEGPARFDVLTPLMAWTESGRAPDRIIASSDGHVTRPVYPYPAVARHTGTGSVDDAANFAPAQPKNPDTPDNDMNLRWLGRRLYSGDYRTWCTATGVELVCRPENTWLIRGELRRPSGDRAD
ncbi:feruloyl esterase [Actinocorallia herbida]|uniref:Feruloyl esterase n=1 Tax=Actinocorallia herbida TaxID=58109 RepID=A0A3N1D966_9ACTN|nr:tannase/feruloyl esterase family alpha/beta hydrolase [Actinocorallia herbida]ROO89618.1 feruloyl esterase [Actinocorallia herbida]